MGPAATRRVGWSDAGGARLGSGAGCHSVSDWDNRRAVRCQQWDVPEVGALARPDRPLFARQPAFAAQAIDGVALLSLKDPRDRSFALLPSPQFPAPVRDQARRGAAGRCAACVSSALGRLLQRGSLASAELLWACSEQVPVAASLLSIMEWIAFR